MERTLGSNKKCSLCRSIGTSKTTCPLNPQSTNPHPMKHYNWKTLSTDQKNKIRQKCELDCIRKRKTHEKFPKLLEYMPYISGEINFYDGESICQCISCQSDEDCNAFYIPRKSGFLKNKCYKDFGCEIPKQAENDYEKTIQTNELRDYL